MKNLILSLIVFIQISASAQFLPPEKVFMQTDRNVYTAGDTVHFRAYVRSYQTGKFEALSTSLYCLLFDRYGRTADSARFRLIKSALSGWLTIPINADTGRYTLVSFTSNMTNSDPKFAFRTSLKITRRATDQRSLHAADPAHKSCGITELRFFPEGGTLVYGEPQLVAFTAVDSADEFQSVEGKVFNGNGEIITGFKTNESGVGVFQINPDSSENYYAVLNRYEDRKWPLPVTGSGISLNVTNTFRDVFYVQIRSNLIINPVHRLLLIQNCDTVLVKELPPANLYKTTIETSKLPPGMATLVLVDQHYTVLAERSVFVNYHKLLSLKLKSSENKEKRIINIKPESQSDSKSEVMLTVSVMDSATGFDYGSEMPDIISTLYFSRDFCQSLPRSIVKKGLFSLDPKSVDELMMTFRPGSNDAMRVSALKKSSDNLKISYHGRQEIQELSFLIPQTAAVIKLNVVNNEVTIPLDSIDPAMHELYLLKSRKIRDFDSLKVDYLANEAYFKEIRRIESKNILPLKNNDTDTTKAASQPDDDAIYFDAVTVKGKRRNIAAVDPHQMFPAGNVKTLTREDIENCQTFEDMLWRLHPLTINRNQKQVVLRHMDSFINPDPPALFVVDGNKVGSSYIMLSDMPVENIESISVLKGQLGYNMYGALNGIIFVTTRSGIGNHSLNLKANSPKAIPVFRNQSSSVQSGKSLVVKEADNPTVIWTDEVTLKNEETCTIHFPASMPRGTYFIRVNAVSMDHSAGSAVYCFRKK